MKKHLYLPLFILLSLSLAGCQSSGTPDLQATNDALNNQLNSLTTQLTQQASLPTQPAQEPVSVSTAIIAPTEAPSAAPSPLPSGQSSVIAPTSDLWRVRRNHPLVE